MTDETTATAVEEAEGAEGAAESDRPGAAGAEVDTPGGGALPPVPVDAGPPPDGWFARYVMPLLLPIGVVAGLLFYVINISRIFLASAGAGAVVAAVTITVAILVGATLLSAAPRMRTSSMTLIVLGAMLLVLAGGSLTVGHAEEKHEEELVFPEVPADLTVTVESFNLGFDPSAFDVETGFFAVTLSNREAGNHNFTIETPGMVAEHIPEVTASGDTDTTPLFVGEAGEYVFYCSVPGHREGGMEGVITASGDPVTFEAAAAQLGGAGGEGGTGGEGTGEPEPGA
jgi:plastocyanin